VPPVPSLAAGGRHAQWRPSIPAYVALDVDGTLVSGEEVPAPAVLAAIGRLTRLGVRVGLATGRMAAANGPLLATGAFTGPHVFHNGAVVRDGDGDDRVVLGLEDDQVDDVLTIGRSRDDVSVEIYVDETYLTDRDDPRSRPHTDLLRLAPSGTIRTASDLGGRSAIKAVIVCFTSEATDAVSDEVRALGLAAGAAASPATPQLRYVNVTRLGVDKGSGVRAVAGLLDISLDQVAAVGDETNDLPLLELVGTGIAMGDASSAVRARAHLIAPRFDEDGTTAALDALLELASGRGLGQRAPGTW
jgi:Cof subfamily protein (haloacid dehalogenase superfamily)